MWFLDPNFLNIIKLWWAEDRCEASKMFVFINKLKMLKEQILRWNREQFHNIFKEKLDIENQLTYLNSIVIRKGMDNHSYLLEKELLAKQELILSKKNFSGDKNLEKNGW